MDKLCAAFTMYVIVKSVLSDFSELRESNEYWYSNLCRSLCVFSASL